MLRSKIGDCYNSTMSRLPLESAPGDVGDFYLLAHTSAGLVEKLEKIGFAVDHELLATLCCRHNDR